jgi:hypothetical protein
MLSVNELISRTLLFGLNVTLTSVFDLIVLLSYHVIRMFLVQKFSYPVATQGHEPSIYIKVYQNSWVFLRIPGNTLGSAPAPRQHLMLHKKT